MYQRCFFTLLLCVSILGAYAQNDNIWSLQRCLDYAKQNNLQLKQAELNLQSNELAVIRSEAARMPNLNAGLGGGNNFGYQVNPFTNEFTTRATQSLNAGINSGVTIYNGGQIYNSIQQSKVDLEAGKLDLKQAEYDLALNIALAYLDILRNAELVESAKVQVASTKEQRDRTAKLVRAGSLAQADLLTLESQIATDELQVVNAQNTLETAYLALMQILQLNPATPFGIEKLELDDPAEVKIDTDLSEILTLAEKTQPFIESAEKNVESSLIGIKIAQGAKLPSLTASANVGTGWASGIELPTGDITVKTETTSFPLSINGGEFQTAETVSSFNEPVTAISPFLDQMANNIGASVNLNLNIPIYNRKQLETNIQQAEVTYKLAKLNSDLTRQTLAQNIQQAYVAAKSALATFQSTNKQIDALELTYTNTEKQFNLGIANSVDFLIAKNNLQRAQFDLVRAKYDYIFRSKVLDFYMGKPLGL